MSSHFVYRTGLRGLATATLFAGTALLGACGQGYGGGPSDPNPPLDPLSVAATPALRFTPSTLTVHVGDAVTFVFGAVGHNLFFDQANGAPANIPNETANASVQRVFNTAGTFHYECHIHPGMAGTIEVQAAN